MTFKKQYLKQILQLTSSSLFIIGTLISSSAFATTPPEFVIKDSMGVNMASGIPSFTVNDLKIGTQGLSLSHSVSSYAGFFYGYHDSFKSAVESDQFKRPNDSEYTEAVKVILNGNTKRFLINADGTYTDFRSEGETLTRLSNGEYLYTTKNGTTMTTLGGLFAHTITYPNGFKVIINRATDNKYRIQSVTTNTGLYSRNTKPILRDQWDINGPCVSYNPSTCQDDPALNQHLYEVFQKELWEYRFPTNIIAINNAVEYCDPLGGICTLTSDWPQSSYKWHNLMPNSMYKQNTDFTVTDMIGNKTIYRHQLYDRAATGSPQQGLYFEPRVKQVLNGHTNAQVISYDYQNKEYCSFNIGGGGEPGTYGCRTNSPAVLIKATRDGVVMNYSVGENGGWQGISHTAGSASGETANVRLNSTYGVPFSVGVHDSNFTLEHSDNNRLLTFSKKGNSSIFSYFYDARGNITKREEVGYVGSNEAATKLITKADYPDTCSNMKTCNQPTWTEDAKGNRTDYFYHEASGKLLRETKPADRTSVRPQVRYKYQQYYARYKNASNNIVQASTPVWLLAEERFCKKGASLVPTTGNYTATGSQCALGASDEVITTYEYGSSTGVNNLFLTGKAISSNTKTLKTCYEYDQYGNQIGETKPLGVTGTCG